MVAAILVELEAPTRASPLMSAPSSPFTLARRL